MKKSILTSRILDHLDQDAARRRRGAAALATVRIAFATRPSRPITPAEVAARDADLEHEVAVLVDLLDADRVGVVDQRAADELDQVARSPIVVGPRSLSSLHG